MNHSTKSELLHQEFCQKMQEASEAYVRDTFQPPPLSKDLLHTIEKTKKKRSHQKLLQVAALFMVLIAGSIPLSIWIQTDSAYGGKGVVRKVVTIFSPLEIQEHTDKDGNWSQTTTIRNLSDLDGALNFFETIYVPQYIPTGYQFQELTFTKDALGVNYTYLYQNEKGILLSITYVFSDSGSHSAVWGEQIDSSADGDLYARNIQSSGEYSAVQITDTYECIVDGYGDKQTGIQIIENMKLLEP